MRKRFLDADINSKSWFRRMTADEKVLWYYIATSCTHDGFWEYDQESVAFYCNGYKGEIPEVIQNKMGMIKVEENQYLLKAWLRFQYKELKENVATHKRIIQRLREKGLDKHFDELGEYYNEG
tara:strand:+ start:1666 stop:2034 length:369 start_codon:yes stop_codon:yes gene_type:complete